MNQESESVELSSSRKAENKLDLKYSQCCAQIRQNKEKLPQFSCVIPLGAICVFDGFVGNCRWNLLLLLRYVINVTVFLCYTAWCDM